ncbi:MAG: DUF3313 family protein [Phycisphaerales bacterium]|nr:DUF3313 family protein [Phycisphaerales bacterium]
MHINIAPVLLASALVISAVSCSHHAITAAPVGFLSQPELMKKAGDGSWNYAAADIDWSKYKTVYVAPVVFAPDALGSGVWGNESDLPNLASKFRAALAGAMSARYQAAQGSGAGTLVVRAQIVKLAPNSPARNLAPQTQIGGTGYGFGEVAIEVLDGGDGTVLLEFAEVQTTSRFSTEKLSVWGSLEKSFTDWANRIAVSCQAK